jgi:hypothetical protein
VDVQQLALPMHPVIIAWRGAAVERSITVVSITGASFKMTEPAEPVNQINMFHRN